MNSDGDILNCFWLKEAESGRIEGMEEVAKVEDKSGLDVTTIKRRSVAGGVTLTSRMALMQVVSFFGIFLLTIFLDPKVFGVFFVVTAIVSFLRYFSDIGLAAALIQKKEEITEEDLKTTFTIQQILVLIIVSSALVFSGWAGDFFKLGAEGLWLFRALILAF